MQDAVIYRKGIGDDKQAIDDIEFFIKQYKTRSRRRPPTRCSAWPASTRSRATRRPTIKALERYLREMGAKGGRDRVVIGARQDRPDPVGADLQGEGRRRRLRQGRARARRPQPRKGKRRRGTVLPDRCGEASKIKLTVIERDKQQAGKATRPLQAGDLRAFGKGVESARTPTRKAVAIYCTPRPSSTWPRRSSRRFLDVKFPEKLDFDPQRQEEGRGLEEAVQEWMPSKKKRAGGPTSMYSDDRARSRAAARPGRSPAAARIGQISQNFADALFTAEVPKDVRTGQFAEDRSTRTATS